MAQTSLSLAIYMLERDYTRNKNARREWKKKQKKQQPVFSTAHSIAKYVAF